MERYDPLKIEQKWQKIWDETEAFKTGPINEKLANGDLKPKMYLAEMFPYPSAIGLHVGHVRNFTIVDVLTRFYTQQQMNVLRPFGYDTFGLPAENFAIKTGISPQSATETNIDNFRKQAKRLGYAVDWSREINTSDPEYYKWTQWCFLQLYKAGLAYQKESYQWWCPVDQTVLANEQVENGCCWRCGTEVQKKKMKQWFFKITDYADELLDNIDALDWPEKIKTMQKNWIGRSGGAEIHYEIAGGPHFIGEDDPPMEGKKNTKRKVVQVYVRDPETDKYLAVEYQDRPWISMIQGGVEGDEDLETAARREVLEETGYKNLKFETALGQFRSEFYAAHKDVNRDIVATQMFFTLENAEREEMSDTEKNIQLPVWLSADEILAHQYLTAIPETNLGFARVRDYLNHTHEAQDDITVFTTRPDTIFGATFLVLAPEHPLIKRLVNTNTKAAVEEYCQVAIKKSEIERQENKEKTGVFTGSYAINPATGKEIPIWVSDYVLMGYGTGAIMAVPAHDERDFEFAEKFDLPVKEVVEKPENSTDDDRCYHGEGVLVNSEQFNGTRSEDAREQIVAWLEERGVGHKQVTYKMRDWLISRQRYWGCPIPIAYDKDGNPHPIPEDQLPVIIPEVEDYKPDSTGRSALAKAKDWLKVTLKDENGNDIECTRETDTLDGYACSSWYLWRYVSPHDDVAAWDPEAIKYWAPTDIYVGGDHAVAHLLYIRFWCKFFADQGYLPFREPVKKLLYNGYINGTDGKKMSKSKGNGVDPLEVINSGYGADTLRTYEMFIGPYDQAANWNPETIGGVYRFLNRCWNLCLGSADEETLPSLQESPEVTTEDEDARHPQRRADATSCPAKNGKASSTQTLRHKTIKKVTEDIYRTSLNTAVAALMEYVNELYKVGASTEDKIALAKMLKPFAPHLASELLERLGSDDEWPRWDQNALVEDTVEVVIQVNGKLRARLELPADILDDPKQLEARALLEENVRRFTEGKEIRKVIIPKGARLVNIVV